jgi:membrane associated rhomboid family serine protease
MLGNLVNAFFYRDTPHISIGSSTAVFGTLGLLVAYDFVARFSSPHTRSRWQLVLPLGAGLALLAFLGVGDEERKQTDYMAHLWGFCSGLALGFPAAAVRVRERAPVALQRVAALVAPLLIAAAWWLALSRVR